MKYDLPDEMTIESDGPIRTLTINRPDKRNAVNAGLHWSLANVWRQLRADREARVVILTGAGKTFCAGGDLKWLRELQSDGEEQEFNLDEGAQIIWEMIRFPLPVIGAINGAAVGLGCSVATLCDIVLISDQAYMADPHVSVGLVAGDGGAAVWPLLTPLLRTKEYLFTGDKISPALAVEVGLASRVVPANALMAEATDLATRLAALPQRALRDTKRTLNAHLGRGAAGAIQAGFAAEGISFGSVEHAAFLDEFARGRT